MTVVIGLSVSIGRLLSQETAVAESPFPDSPSLLRQQDKVRFHLLMGRLRVDPVRYRKGRQQSQARRAADGNRIDESLAVDAHRGYPQVHYCRRSRGRRISLDIDHRGGLSIRAGDESETTRMVITQPPQGPLVVRIDDRDASEQSHYATWIHFYVARPGDYDHYVGALIDDLLYPLRLTELAESAHAESLAQIGSRHACSDETAEARGTTQPDRLDDASLAEWVEQLGANRLADRSAAHRVLLRQGISVLPRLQRLDVAELDAEQRARLQTLRAMLVPRGEDSPSRVAALIRDDHRYWVAAAKRLSDIERDWIAARFEGPEAERRVRVAKVPSSAGDGR